MSKEKISDDNSNNWICPVCGTKNNEKECTTCGHVYTGEKSNNIKLVPSSIEPKNKYKKFMITTIIVCFVLLILGESYKLIITEKETSLGNMDKIANEITLLDDNDDDFNQNIGARSNLSLDGLDLGDSISDMKNVLGRDYTKKSDGIYIIYKYSNMEVTTEDGKIVALVSDSNKVSTKAGIHTGSDYRSMINEYGKPDYEMKYDDLILYEYIFKSIDNRDGLLRFAINKSNNKVNYISVRIPEDENLNTEAVERISRINSSETNSTNIREAVQTLNNYYEAINENDMRAAYNILSDDMQTHMGNLNDYADGYKTTLSDSISNVQVTSNSGDEIALSYILTARDSYNGNSIKEQTFACTALLSKKTGSWHIVDMSAKKQGERIMSR